MNLEELFVPTVNPISVKPESLAYIGDVVLKLVFIKKSMTESSKAPELHKDSVFHNNRGYQSELLLKILDMLTEEEMWVVRRAKNSKSARKFGNDIEYKNATALEALVGFLFLKKDFDRINLLLSL